MTRLAEPATRTLLVHPSPSSVLLEALAERFTPDLRLVVPNVQAGRDLRTWLRNAGQAITLTQLARNGYAPRVGCPSPPAHVSSGSVFVHWKSDGACYIQGMLRCFEFRRPVRWAVRESR